MTGIFCMRNRMTGHQLAGKAVNGYIVKALQNLDPFDVRVDPEKVFVIRENPADIRDRRLHKGFRMHDEPFLLPHD